MQYSPSGTGSRRVYQKRNMEKCQQCRGDHKSCLPIDREWPVKCDRCSQRGLPCGPPTRAPRRNQPGSRSGPRPRTTLVSPHHLRAVAPFTINVPPAAPILDDGAPRHTEFHPSILSSQQDNIRSSTSSELVPAHDEPTLFPATLIDNDEEDVDHNINETRHYTPSDSGDEADLIAFKRHVLHARLFHLLRVALKPLLESSGSLARWADKILGQIHTFSTVQHTQGFHRVRDHLRRKGTVEEELATLYTLVSNLETACPVQTVNHGANEYHQLLALTVRRELEAKRSLDICSAQLKLITASSSFQAANSASMPAMSPEIVETWALVIIDVASQLGEIWKGYQAGLVQGEEVSQSTYAIPPAHLVLLLDLGDKVLAHLLSRAPEHLRDQDLLGQTVLHLAAVLGQSWAVEMALESFRASNPHATLDYTSLLDIRNAFLQTPILIAAKQGDLAVVSMLHHAGASKDTADPDGCGILEAAVESGNTELVHYVLSQMRISPSGQRGVRGSSPIHRAAKQGLIEIFRILVERGAPFLEPDYNDGWKSVLQQAKEHGHHDLVVYLRGIHQDWTVGGLFLED